MINYLVVFRYLLDKVTQSNAVVVGCDYIEYNNDSISFFQDGFSLPDFIIPLEAILYIKIYNEEEDKLSTGQATDNKSWAN